MFRGEHPERPFLIVCQQSEFDSSRAPGGKQTGLRLLPCPRRIDIRLHRAVESQVERFAPGFKSRILARKTTSTTDFHAYNPNYVGGAITGGVADFSQLFTRPVVRINPYTTPNPRVMICSASTPPGGGVHGMCGYHAAQTAIGRIPKLSVAELSRTITIGNFDHR